MGKGIFPEKHPQFIGIYTGDVSSPYLRKRIDESDCIISIGVKLTDTITGGFTQGFMKEQVIEIHPYTVKITDKKYGPVVMKDVLQHLSDLIEHRNGETLDIKPFISESLSMTEEFNPKAQMVTQKRFVNKYTISYKKRTSYLQNKEHLSLVVPLSLYQTTLHM